MSFNKDYFGEVTNALHNLTAEQHRSVQERLSPSALKTWHGPSAAMPQALSEPESRDRGGSQPGPVTFDGTVNPGEAEGAGTAAAGGLFNF